MAKKIELNTKIEKQSISPDRIKKALDFIIYEGMAKDYTDIGKIIKVGKSNLSDYKTGTKSITVDSVFVEKLVTTFGLNLSFFEGKSNQIIADPKKITDEYALLRVVVREFATYKAEKEGGDPDKIVKDMESKAKLIMDVSENT